jgi:hypothetical protein
MTMTKWQAGAILTSLVFSAGTLLGQVVTPDSGLTFSGLIPIPNWTTSAAGVNLSSYDAVNQVLYYADHVWGARERHQNEFGSGLGTGA